jgi:hypothetical protein
VSLSSARTTKRLPSPRCASAMKIVCPRESIAETQPQLQPVLLRLSAVLLIVVDHLRRSFAHLKLGLSFTVVSVNAAGSSPGKNSLRINVLTVALMDCSSVIEMWGVVLHNRGPIDHHVFAFFASLTGSLL